MLARVNHRLEVLRREADVPRGGDLRLLPKTVRRGFGRRLLRRLGGGGGGFATRGALRPLAVVVRGQHHSLPRAIGNVDAEIVLLVRFVLADVLSATLPVVRPVFAHESVLVGSPEAVLERLVHLANLLLVALLLEARVGGGALGHASFVVVRGVVEVDVIHHLFQLLAIEQAVRALGHAALDDAVGVLAGFLHLHLLLVRGVAAVLGHLRLVLERLAGASLLLRGGIRLKERLGLLELPQALFARHLVRLLLAEVVLLLRRRGSRLLRCNLLLLLLLRPELLRVGRRSHRRLLSLHGRHHRRDLVVLEAEVLLVVETLLVLGVNLELHRRGGGFALVLLILILRLRVVLSLLLLHVIFRRILAVERVGLLLLHRIRGRRGKVELLHDGRQGGENLAVGEGVAVGGDVVARQPGAPRRLAHDLLLRRGGLRLLPRHARLLLLFGLVFGDGRRGDGGGGGGARRVVEVELILGILEVGLLGLLLGGGLLHLLVFAQGTFFAHAHLELAFLVVLVVVEVALSLGGSLGGVVLVELGLALGVAEGGVLRGRGALLAELELLLAGELGVVVVVQLVVRGFWGAVGLARVDGASGGDVVLDVSSTLGVRLVPRALAARLEDELLLILLVRSDRNRIDRSLHGDGNLLRGSGVDWRHNLRGAHLSICAPAFEKGELFAVQCG